MYSGIKSSKNGYHSIAYPATDKADQKGLRVGAFRCGGGIIDTGDIKGIQKQFAEVWKAGGRSQIGKSIQTYNILLSFSRNEISPDEQDAFEHAADIAEHVIKRMYPGHQYTLVVQADGAGGMLHVHGTVNALCMQSLKACRGRQTSYRTLREEIEKELENGGIDIDRGSYHTKKELKKAYRVRAEKAATGHSWTDEITEKISKALRNTERFSELENNLSKEGVGVLKKQKKNWTFILLQSEEPSFAGRKAKGDTLSTDFVPSKMRAIVDKNYRDSISIGEMKIYDQRKDAIIGI